jgi:hypothetical protein
VGAVHLYNVPAGTTPSVPLVGETEKVAPEQIVAVSGFNIAIGNTCTVNVKVFPMQVPAVGVT